MTQGAKPKFYLVEAGILPEIFIKVTEAKALLEAGEAATVAEAVARVGLSRSAFYKYKDSISPFQDLKRGHILTFHMVLRDRMGVLSSVLSIFSASGANILTINQSIPTGSTAAVTISAGTDGMEMTTEELMERIADTPGVVRIEALAG